MPDGQKIIDTFHDQIDEEKEKVDKTSENILGAISIDKVLTNPKQELMKIATKYYESHGSELKKAIKLGKKEATEMVNKYVKTNKERDL